MIGAGSPSPDSHNLEFAAISFIGLGAFRIPPTASQTISLRIQSESEIAPATGDFPGAGPVFAIGAFNSSPSLALAAKVLEIHLTCRSVYCSRDEFGLEVVLIRLVLEHHHRLPFIIRVGSGDYCWS